MKRPCIRPAAAPPLALAAVALAVALVAAAVPVDALAQPAASVPQPRPKLKGRTHVLRIDSSPQQATVYWDSRDYGVAGYTPISIKVPRRVVKLIIDLRGFKTIERDVDVKRSQTITFTMEKATQPGKLDLRSMADGNATGAEVLIDGVPRGTIPNLFELTPGRHQLEVRKSGFKTLSDWVDVEEDRIRTRDIHLEKAEAPPGSLLVTSDAGGDVYVDGTRRDAAPAMITGVPPGDHVVEVRKEGAAPWRQTVTVISGQQVKVAAALGAPAPAPSALATLRVISNEPDVDVYVDGEHKGKAPAEVRDVKPGQHIVEGRKPKFKIEEQIAKLTPNEQLLVRLKAEPSDEKPKGMLRVQSAVPDAEVFLDGSSLGKAPVDRNDLEPGKHYIIVRKDGFVDFKREVNLVENKPVIVAAELRSVGGLKFLSSPQGAQVLIDGEPVGGITPNLKEEVAAGEHVIEMRLAGYFDAKQTIKVEGGRERIVSSDLQRIPTGPTPEQVSRRKAGMTSFGARAIPAGSFTADLGAGLPYLFSGRLTVGAFAIKPVAFDAGVEVRTFFQLFEFDVHGRLQVFESGPLSFAARGDIGGGGGPNGRNTFFFDFGPVVSLTFNEIVTFSGNLRFNYWSDQLCPSQRDIENNVEPRFVCQEENWPRFFDKDPRENRFGGSRVYAGTALEVSASRKLSLFVLFDFLPLQYNGRKAYTDAFSSVQLKRDPLIYGTAGATLKF